MTPATIGLVVLLVVASAALGKGAGGDKDPKPLRERTVKLSDDVRTIAGLEQLTALTEVVDNSRNVVAAPEGLPTEPATCASTKAYPAVTMDALFASLPGRYAPNEAVSLPARWQFRITDDATPARWVEARGSGVTTTVGETSNPDVVVVASAATISAVMSGYVTADEMLACAGIELTGNPDRAKEFVTLFPPPARP